MTEERIITNAIVTLGEKGDGPFLPTLLEDSIKNGMEIDTVISDTAYSGKDNLDFGKKVSINIVAKLNPIISHGTRKEEDKFDYNKDANMFVCPSGHMSIRRAQGGKKNENKNQVTTYYFDVEKCKICPLKEGCYKPGAKTKTYPVSIQSKTHSVQMEFKQSEFFKEKAQHRYKIEAKTANLKMFLDTIELCRTA